MQLRCGPKWKANPPKRRAAQPAHSARAVAAKRMRRCTVQACGSHSRGVLPPPRTPCLGERGCGCSAPRDDAAPRGVDIFTPYRASVPVKAATPTFYPPPIACSHPSLFPLSARNIYIGFHNPS